MQVCRTAQTTGRLRYPAPLPQASWSRVTIPDPGGAGLILSPGGRSSKGPGAPATEARTRPAPPPTFLPAWALHIFHISMGRIFHSPPSGRGQYWS